MVVYISNSLKKEKGEYAYLYNLYICRGREKRDLKKYRNRQRDVTHRSVTFMQITSINVGRFFSPPSPISYRIAGLIFFCYSISRKFANRREQAAILAFFLRIDRVNKLIKYSLFHTCMLLPSIDIFI